VGMGADAGTGADADADTVADTDADEVADANADADVGGAPRLCNVPMIARSMSSTRWWLSSCNCCLWELSGRRMS